MHAQFPLLFGLHNAMVLLSKLSWKIKLNTVEDNSEKKLRKNLTATPFSYINDASVDLNEVCLHITYLFLKELVFVSDVFLLALLSHENLHLLPEEVLRVFSPKSTPLVYSTNLFIYLFLFYLFIYFIVIANIFFFKSIAWNLFSRIPYSVSVSVSVIPFPFPYSGFHVLVLPFV